MNNIKLCFDARVLEWQRGALASILINYVKRLLSSRQYEIILLFQKHIPEDEWLKHRNIELILVKGPKFIKNNKVLTEQLIFPFYLYYLKYDLYFGWAYSVPIFPIYKNKIVALWDISFTTHPSHYRILEQLFLHNLAKLSAKLSMGVITCSSYDALMINKYYKNDNIEILKLGIDDKYFNPMKIGESNHCKNKYSMNKLYFLVMGVIYNRRNVDVIIEAFKSIMYKYEEVNLIVIGRPQKGLRFNIKSKMNSIENKKRGSYYEWVDEECIKTLYSSAYYYICTSTVDGESLMLKEAMATGTPVITSPLLSKAVGGINLLIEDPTNIYEWKEIMIEALSDRNKRNYLAKEGSKWVKQFSWDNSYNQFSKYIEAIVKI